MTPEQIIVALTALLAGEPHAGFDALRDGGHDRRYPVTVESCPRPLPPLDVEGRTVICGRVDVPEDHGAPDGRTVPLAFALLKARSESPAPDPVIYLHGGPGGYTVQEIPGHAQLFDFLRGRRDVVIFDQRASGISDRTISCYNTQAEKIVDFARHENLFDPEGAIFKCLAEVKAQGIDLRHYNTTQNARDVRAIMHALGYPTYNALGISYGTKLGQELLRAAPEGLRSLVIDSISRVDNPAYDTNGVPVDQSLGWVVDYCAADAQCAAAYPDLEATINAVGRKLKEQPISPKGTGGKAIDWSIIPVLAGNGNKVHGPHTAYLPLIFTELNKGETTTLDKLLSGGFNPRPLDAASLVAPYAAKLSDHDRAIARVVAMQAEQMRSLEGAIASLLATLSDDVAASGRSETEQRLDDVLSEIARGMETEAVLAMVQDYVRFIGGKPDRLAIEDFVRRHVPAAEQARVLGLVAAMTADDVAAFYARASIDEARLTSYARMHFSLGVYACQEDVPFNSREGYAAAVAGYRFPAVAAVAEDDMGIYDFCDLFEHHERPGYHEPVVSDIPVLAMAGTRDTQTNPDAAEKVVRTLKNGFAFTFPEAGHGVITFSQCAKDITAAFIEDPSAKPNGACMAALRPHFLLPDGTMSGG